MKGDFREDIIHSTKELKQSYILEYSMLSHLKTHYKHYTPSMMLDIKNIPNTPE